MTTDDKTSAPPLPPTPPTTPPTPDQLQELERELTALGARVGDLEENQETVSRTLQLIRMRSDAYSSGLDDVRKRLHDLAVKIGAEAPTAAPPVPTGPPVEMVFDGTNFVPKFSTAAVEPATPATTDKP